MRLITDLVDLGDVTLAAREQPFPQLTLNQFIPDVEGETIDYRFVTSQFSGRAAAGYRSFDAESRIGDQPAVRAVSGQLPPLSVKVPLPESENLRMRQLANTAEAAVESAIYSRAQNVTRAVRERLERARGQALSTGTISLTDDGMDFEIEFAVPPENFPTAANSWLDDGTDILAELSAWADQYEAVTGGFRPGVAVTSRQVIAAMLGNPSLRPVQNNGDPTAGTLSLEQLNNILATHDLPQVVAHNVRVPTGDADGGVERVIPANRFIMLPSPEDATIGSTQFGVTAEAMELRDEGVIAAEDTPGLVVVTLRSDDPVTVWTKGAALALPVIDSPEGLFSAEVFDS